HRERRAVGEHPARAAQADATDCEQVRFELEFGQAPGLAAQAAGAQLDASFEVALVLLQVLRPQEQPLAPDDLVVLRHPLAARPSRRPRTQDKPCPGRTAAVRSGRARTARPAARILASLPERGPTIRLSGRRGAGP